MSAARKPKASQPGLAPIEAIGVNELELLRRAPYDRPYRIATSHESKIADALVAADLLERDPSAPAMVRCTSRGESVREPLSLTRARLAVQEIRIAVEDGDPEAAASLERRLHDRVLTEIATERYTEQAAERSASLARIALTSAAIAFRRY